MAPESRSLLPLARLFRSGFRVALRLDRRRRLPL